MSKNIRTDQTYGSMAKSCFFMGCFVAKIFGVPSLVDLAFPVEMEGGLAVAGQATFAHEVHGSLKIPRHLSRPLLESAAFMIYDRAR